MNLKEEMYVRTKRGQLGKITTIGKYNIVVEVNEMWQDIVSKTDIAKEPSFNIIDLIEEGDYVNGIYVNDFEDGKPFHREEDDYYNVYWENEDIKSIVTKEHFDNIAYKIKQ